MTVSISDVTHELQLASLLLQPARLDASGYVASYHAYSLKNIVLIYLYFFVTSHPVFLTLSEVPHQMLPARFLLTLQPPMPLLLSFITTVSIITGWVASSFKS